jgi:hypothetical protein
MAKESEDTVETPGRILYIRSLREFEADNCMSKKKISLVCYKHI